MVKASPAGRSTAPIFSPGAVLRGVLVSFLTYLVLALVVATLIYFWGDLELQLASLTYGAGLVAALSGGFVAGRQAGHTGWLHGLAGGALFIVLSYYIAVFLWPVPAAAGIFGRRLLLGAALGLAGGAVGANL